jgi:choline dehydrogenase
VILCGGAINSPQLLQLSGVGDAALLARHGIEVVAESPAVGRNLQDHLAVSYFYRSKVPTLNDVYSCRSPARSRSHCATLRAGAGRLP